VGGAPPELEPVKSLTAEGLSAVGGLTTLTWLWNCSNVTDVGLQELTFLARPRSPGALGLAV
jgi:hypothetical protein